MLRSFRMGNHRSFRHEQELLLMPAYAKNQLAVPVAAIYGANASGKSNLLDGLKFMADAVRDSFGQWRPGSGVPRRSFKLDPLAGEEPSIFVAELVEKDVRYTYGFEIDDKRICSEWLYSYPEKRKRVLFERDVDQIKFGKAIAGAAAKVEVLEDLLRPDALFLSLAAQSNVKALVPVYRWFVDRLSFRLCGYAVDVDRHVADFLLANEGKREQMVELVRAADFGISGIEVAGEYDAEVETVLRQYQDRLTDMERSRRDLINKLHGINSMINAGETSSELANRRDKLTSQYAELHGRMRHVDNRMKAVQAAAETSRSVRLSHGVGEPFRLAEESAGTQAWLGMLPTVLTVLAEGGTLVVDEIDASLHSLLAGRLVALFNDPDSNRGGGQLIFTTHDATLLHPPLADRVLNRDEVWFVEKDATGASVLYPLTEFRPRNEDNLERRYLAGLYGAVPEVHEELFARAVRGEADVEA
ncbi:AAA family ATPase [Saccharothrix coeruleofusca]|uniref:ATPase AAA-type core domain-containing protein n=1 Tax=Saccharothrix coeruleofusca TaxID=33919 RepID=A0A918AM99_9PSEU|nr:ATP-binding protein [Saccharothrix coeruleofusca]GGP48605.1 hypothetical protein GCM10010185_20890 [Saccharothrix coeruleofusca]